MNCATCGHALAIEVRAPQWTFAVPCRVPSLNERMQNAGPGRWAYTRLRGSWATAMKVLARDIPRATGKRGVRLTRVLGKRQRMYDYDNFVGGAKSCIDSMVKAGLIVGDSAKFVDVTYEQERGAKEGARVEVWEL